MQMILCLASEGIICNICKSLKKVSKQPSNLFSDIKKEKQNWVTTKRLQIQICYYFHKDCMTEEE